MPSTYTDNLGLEKIPTGGEVGTWGPKTNINFDVIDLASNGQVTITLPSAGSSGSPNDLGISDGMTSEGHNKFIEFNDGGDLGATAYVQLTPSNSEKICYVKNSLSGGQSILFFQGTYSASNDYELTNGSTAILRFDGAGAGAVVSEIATGGSGVDQSNMAITGGTINGTSVGASTPASGAFTTLSATGTITFSGAISSIDINGGTVDGVTIGASSAGAGTFTTVTASTYSGLPAATTSVQGIVELATQTQVNAGTVGSLVVTAETLAGWTGAGGGGGTTLSALTDTLISGPTNNHLLSYSSGLGMWTNTAISSLPLVSDTTSVLAGNGLTGGGTLTSNVTLTVGQGTGIDVNSSNVALDLSSGRNVDHDSVSISAGTGLDGGGTISTSRSISLDTGSDRNTDHGGVSIIAGAGLTGGGNITQTRTLNVGAGTGINVSADSISFDTSFGDSRYQLSGAGGTVPDGDASDDLLVWSGLAWVAQQGAPNALKLGGNDAARFTRDNTNESISGNWTWSDNDRVRFGTSQNCAFYCDGTDLFLELNDDCDNFKIGNDGIAGTAFEVDRSTLGVRVPVGVDVGNGTRGADDTIKSRVTSGSNFSVVESGALSTSQQTGFRLNATDTSATAISATFGIYTGPNHNGYAAAYVGLSNTEDTSTWFLSQNAGTLYLDTNSGNIGEPTNKSIDTTAVPSDERLKNIEEGPFPYGLEATLALKPIRYEYKKGKGLPGTRVGFSAQNVQRVLPEAISVAHDDYLGLDNKQVVPVLVSAVHELVDRLNGVCSRVEELTQRIVDMENGADGK